jgi:ribosomal-protein-alanine N-acetyltransferase
MAAGPELRTERLLLRRWRASDLEPFAVLNADPEVMRHFPAPLTRAESDATVESFEAEFEARDFGPWAVEVVGGAPFVGFVGLHQVSFASTFTPATEIGWRLAREHWGHGYAIEAATEALRYGRDELGLDPIVSFTTPGNRRSRSVMERLGLVHDPLGDFDHPRIDPRSPLRRHVLYRYIPEGSVPERPSPHEAGG